MDWVVVLGYAVVALAAARLVWWLLAYIAGDVREVFRHRAARQARRGLFRPKVSVLVHATDADADLLEGCLHSVFTGTQRPASVVVLAAGDVAYQAAAAYQRTYGASPQLTVVPHEAPVDTIADIGRLCRKHGKGSLGVFVRARHHLDARALHRGMQHFRDKHVAVLGAPAVARLDHSVWRALVCAQQLVARHVQRARRGSAASVYGAIFLRRHAPWSSLLQRPVYAPDVYVYEHVRQPVRAFVLSRNRSALAPLWVSAELAAIGAVLYTYGTSRGLLMLSFAGGLALLLVAVAIWAHKGVGASDKVSIFLLAPFVWVGYVLGAFTGALRRLGARQKSSVSR